ncbi:class I SAM-dependent methyltransferase [uncultured Microbulbifer sp.]|uniref:class I SAM-dependent methyltransferase n=1 Tax=uncultured Microbulbifer sp. TaxID=348147 RepID=UPI002627212A|nr:class I SAM-dependent methyltransferase [uncultured Microbulbifer sp.]
MSSMSSKSRKTPPGWHVIGKHGVFPKANHDETARFNFLTNLNMHVAQEVMPGVQSAYEKRARPRFESDKGRPPATRQEVRRLMEADPYYQTWSSLRRNIMEMRQQNGRSLAYRQWDQLNQKAADLNSGSTQLQLDPALPLPRYVSAVDIHCMPGCYYTEYCEDDVSVAANYDSGIFVTTAGMLGKYSDGGGQAIVAWLHEQAKQGFKPKRILDMGCTVGHNIVPIAQAFPETEIVAVDVAAPVLRYAHARAKSLGVENITFRQANAESLDYADGSFDLVITCMFLHELSSTALPNVINETHRLTRAGGRVLHIEQPQFTDDMPLFEQFMRDWDSRNNNEPFWGTMHDIDVFALMENAGFARSKLSSIGLTAVVDESLFPSAGDTDDAAEDYGRKPAWHVYVAEK